MYKNYDERGRNELAIILGAKSIHEESKVIKSSWEISKF